MRVIFLLFLITGPAVAQQPARGVFSYRVDGIFQGELMEPWSATTQVGDSAGSWFLRQVVQRGPGTHFEYVYRPHGDAVWINEGRMASSTCRASLQDEVPDFALPYALASMVATSGPVKLTMLKCVADAVQRIPVEATIQRDTSGWHVEGAEPYPFSLLISTDRRVLKFVQPQGTVGSATYSLVACTLPPDATATPPCAND